jgi:hypothetical protein
MSTKAIKAQQNVLRLFQKKMMIQKFPQQTAAFSDIIFSNECENVKLKKR